MTRLAFLLIVFAAPLWAETVIATRTLRPQEVIKAEDVRLGTSRREGAYTALSEVIGRETQIAIYPGRPVMRGTLSAPALVDRNQVVELIYNQGSLRIMAEGRALGRGSAGDRIRVMNLASRAVLFGTIAKNGSVLISQ